jgi:hypothetical protein
VVSDGGYRHPGRVTHWVVYEDGSTVAVAADHFSFETSYLKLTHWSLVMMRPREVVLRRLLLRGPQPILGVMTDAT